MTDPSHKKNTHARMSRTRSAARGSFMRSRKSVKVRAGSAMMGRERRREKEKLPPMRSDVKAGLGTHFFASH